MDNIRVNINTLNVQHVPITRLGSLEGLEHVSPGLKEEGVIIRTPQDVLRLLPLIRSAYHYQG